MKQVPIQDPSLHSETINPPMLSVLSFNPVGGCLLWEFKAGGDPSQKMQFSGNHLSKWELTVVEV